MSHIFISHSHEDKPFVRRLAADLGSHHHNVWLDEAEIRVGESLLQKISQAIDDVDYVVAVVSDTSVESEWVKRELDIAMNREFEEKRVVVLPLILTRKRLPAFLRGKLYADFTDQAQYYPSLLKILKTVAIPPKATAVAQRSASPRPVVGRSALSPGGLLELFATLVPVVHGHNITPYLQAEVVHESENEFWNRETYEGYIAASSSFVALYPSALLPAIAEADARVGAVALLMGRHLLDVWTSAKTDEGLLPPGTARPTDHDDAWKDAQARAAPEVRGVLVRYCPPRESQCFYLGWQYFASRLFDASLAAMDESATHSTAYYVGRVIGQILGLTVAFENKHDEKGYGFWIVVFVYLRDLISESSVHSLPYVRDDEEGFVEELETELGITDTRKEEWRKVFRETGRLESAVALAWLELRGQFQFDGYGEDDAFHVLVTQRS